MRFTDCNLKLFCQICNSHGVVHNSDCSRMDDECTDARKHEIPLYGFRPKKDPLLVLVKKHLKVILNLPLRAPEGSFKKLTPFDKTKTN